MNLVPMRANNDGHDDDDGRNDRDAEMRNGVCDHLQEMILEVQQMALRLGAGEVAATLQAAYLEARLINSRGQPDKTA